MIDPARMRAPAPIRASPEMPGRPDGYPSRTPGSTTAPAPRRTSAAPAAHGDDLAHLVRVCPAHVNVADHVVVVAERRERDVVALGAQHARADGRRPSRLLAEQVVEDGDVVRREIPDRVDVVANGS